MILFDIAWSNIDANSGFIVFTVGILIVFATLAVLYGCFTLVSKIITFDFKKKTKGGSSEELAGIENAAIATALYIYMTEEQHVYESGVITIEKRVNKYSPWSSKLYSLTKAPVQKF